jgi:MFS family permease
MGTTTNGDESASSYRKRTVWMLAIAETIVWAGMFYLFPALLPHWEQDLGWAKTELAGAFTCALILSALAAPFAGRLIDRGHGRKVLTISAFCGGLLLVLLSQVRELWQF